MPVVKLPVFIKNRRTLSMFHVFLENTFRYFVSLVDCPAIHCDRR